MRNEIKAIIILLLLFILLAFSFVCNANKVNDTNNNSIPTKMKVMFDCKNSDFYIVGKLSDKTKPSEKYWELYLTSGNTTEEARKLSAGSICIACFYGPYVRVTSLKNGVVLIQTQHGTVFKNKETIVKFKEKRVAIEYINYNVLCEFNFEDEYGCGGYDEKTKAIQLWID